MSDTNFEESMDSRLGVSPNGRLNEDLPPKAAKAARKAKAMVDDNISRLAERAHTTVDKWSDRAASTYGDLSTRAQQVAGRVEPMVKERPYAALGIALGIGAVLGMIMTARAPRVIYLKSPRTR